MNATKQKVNNIMLQNGHDILPSKRFTRDVDLLVQRGAEILKNALEKLGTKFAQFETIHVTDSSGPP